MKVKELLEQYGISLSDEVISHNEESTCVKDRIPEILLKITFSIGRKVKSTQSPFIPHDVFVGKNETRFQEIFKLKEMLDKNNVAYDSFHKLSDGFQITIARFAFDVIEHSGSYGNREDRLEIMGLLTKAERENDSVLGNLTAKQVFNRIVKEYKARGIK